MLFIFFFAYEVSCPDDQIKLIKGNTEQNGHVGICSDESWETFEYVYWWTPYATEETCIDRYSSNTLNL